MSYRTAWTSDEDRELIRLKAKGLNFQQMGDAMGRSRQSVWSHYNVLVSRGFSEQNAQDLFDTEVTEFDEQVIRRLGEEQPSEPIHWRNLISLAEETRGALEALEPSKDIRVKRVPGKPYPIGLFSGDWHLGHKATSYSRWIYEISMLLRSENTFLIELGDERQNSRSTRHLAWVLSQVLPVELQAQIIVSVTQELVSKGKFAAKVGGTHDLWFDEGVAGQALLKWLYQQNESIAFFQNKGVLQLIVEFEDGEREFPHLLYHKSRYKSFLNTLHGNIREYQLTMPGKIVAGAHDHEPGAMLYWHYGTLERMGYDIGGWSWLIKVGAFTAGDDQFRDLGSFYHRTEVFCPACVYMPEGIVLLPTLRDALAFRAGVPAAKKHEEELIDGLSLSQEQKEQLKKQLIRQFGV